MPAKKRTKPSKAQSAKARTSKAKLAASPSSASLPALLKKLGISQAKLSNHVMRPEHTINVSSDTGPAKAPRKFAALGRKRAKLKHLNVENFGWALHDKLKDKVIGYCMRLRQHGETIFKLDWNWAQTTEDDGIAWSADKRMHVASVSKLITAMAMTRLLLDKKSISADSKIIDFLPTYWVKGQNINKITFRHLLTHTSGFAAGGQQDYERMKNIVQLGVFKDPPFNVRLGKYSYENMNFGLCRILISIIHGDVDKNLVVADEAWDLLTIVGYSTYVALKVFGPAGVTKATLDHPDKSALAYFYPPSSDGWDSGNLLTQSGGAGWHLSVTDLLKVMGTFRRQGTIMSKDHAQWMLDNSFGIDVTKETPAGTLYEKNGLWRQGSETWAQVEQSVAYFLPEDMEMAVFVNSYVGMPPNDLQTLVTDKYLAHLN